VDIRRCNVSLVCPLPWVYASEYCQETTEIGAFSYRGKWQVLWEVRVFEK
jgi:hypothetical protein